MPIAPNARTAGLVAAFLLACIVAGPVRAASSAPEHRVVIDAGSSGSRIYLYEVRPGPYPAVTELFSFKGLPGDDGIDDYLGRLGGPDKNWGPDKVRQGVIGPLLAKVAPLLAERGVKPAAVRVDFLATAGMRSAVKPVGPHDQAEAEALYARIREAVAAEGYAPGDARTTDGDTEEGIWTWIDVNDRYRNAFRTDNAPVGVVEVGGSSMQVTFPTADPPDPAKGVRKVAINGRAFSVFGRTYLGLGQDDARKAMRMMAPPADGGARCFPTGMAPQQDSGDLIAGQRVRIAKEARFDGQTCGASYAAVVTAGFARTPAPEVGRSLAPFYGISAARYVFEQIEATPQLPNEQGLNDAMHRRCAPEGAASRLDLRKAFDQRACSGAAYMKELLYGRSGLFHGQPDQFKSTIADRFESGDSSGSINWTRGYLLQSYAKGD